VAGLCERDTSMNQNQELVVIRIVAAFLIAPLATPLTFIVFGLIRTGGINSESYGVVIFVGMYAYLAVIVLGIPAFLIFRAMHWKNPILFGIGGILIGFAVSLFFQGWISSYYPRNDILNRLWTYILPATLSALVFRLILPSSILSRKTG
jgi:hypothetical protein